MLLLPVSGLILRVHSGKQKHLKHQRNESLMLGFLAPDTQRKQMFLGRKAARHHTLQTTCLGHSQSWDWPCSQANCMGQLAFFLNRREARKQKHADSSFTLSLNYFWEAPCEFWKMWEGKVVTDVGRDLGGSSVGSLEHVWLWVTQKDCPSQMVSLGFQQVSRNEWCQEDFLSHFYFSVFFIVSVITESWANWRLKEERFSASLTLLKPLYENQALTGNMFTFQKNLES